MREMLSALIERLVHAASLQTDVIPWSSPVPAFGDPMRARVATLGLNPSNREFVDCSGNELDGASRRFHTLRSLGLSRWSEANEYHTQLIMESCCAYFYRNPYDSWFKKLDFVISGTEASYYGESELACHLDLIPFATAHKWTELTRQQRFTLLKISGDALASLIRESPIQLLVLNGRSVVQQFEEISGKTLDRRQMSRWALPREAHAKVLGYAYSGAVSEVSGIKLGRELLVLGFNHNIQSSFGVTKQVTEGIRDWIAKASMEAVV